MADKLSDGGPAFPLTVKYSDTSGALMPGMSIRDWFAGQALAGLCANPGGPFQKNDMTGWGIVNCSEGYVAALCNRLADAMLAARSSESSNASR